MRREGLEPKRLERSGAALATISIAGAAVASAVTLAWPGAFPDPVPPEAVNAVLAEARGWSAVTLALGVPLGVVTLIAGRRGSMGGLLGLTGAMAYLAYTYLMMAVSPPFTPLYLVYVATFACAIPAMVLAIATIDLEALPAALGDRMPRRALAAFAFAFAAVLALAWSKGIVDAMLAGAYGWPTGAAAVGHVVHALDLGLQVPLGIATGVLVLARRPSGYVLGAITVVMGVVMGAALVAMVAVAAFAAGQSLLVAAPFAVVPLVAGALAYGFFGAIGAPAR